IWETERQSLVFGARGQYGEIDTHAKLARVLTGVVTDQGADTTLEREDAYAYYSVKPLEPLRLIGGITYSRLSFPENTDLPPISSHEASSEIFAPKAGLLWTPWTRGLVRATYTRSLGGLFFDNSVRLEPTEVG